VPSRYPGAHHVTVVAQGGNIGTHITRARGLQPEAWRRVKKKLVVDAGDAYLVGAFFIKRPQALPVVGRVTSSFEDVKGFGDEECDRYLSECLVEKHPVLELLGETAWDANHHLRVGILITPGGRFVKKDYPLLLGAFPSLVEDVRTPPPETRVGQTKIPLSLSANLLITYFLYPGVLNQEWYLY